MENKTVSQAISEAINGESESLKNLISTLSKERENLLILAQNRIAAVDGQIELLKVILQQVDNNGVD